MSVGLGFDVGMVCDEVLDWLSLLLVIMFVYSGFCWIVPLVRIGGVKKADLLCEESGMIPVLMIAIVTMIATSFHLYEKGIGYPPFSLLIIRFVSFKDELI